jgi:hypothetical protein
MRGRQAFWLICQWFKIAEGAGALFDLSDLLKVQYEGVGLPIFSQNWNTVLSGMKVLPDDTTLATLFHLQVKHCKQIEFDINAYDRAKPGEPNRSYKFLLDSANSFLARKRQVTNRQAVEKALTTGIRNPGAGGDKPPGLVAAQAALSAAQSALAAAQKGNGKKKGDGKGKTERASSTDAKVCYSWRDKGTCTRGDQCGYPHPNAQGKDTRSKEAIQNSKKLKDEKEKGRAQTPPNAKREKSNEICSFHLKGLCHFGEV